MPKHRKIHTQAVTARKRLSESIVCRGRRGRRKPYSSPNAAPSARAQAMR
ncbi:MAG: hypothetical protein MSH58_00530 [Clostridiales bacterium]|nr:hypothetical protein [Clostridiales bacterium]